MEPGTPIGMATDLAMAGVQVSVGDILIGTQVLSGTVIIPTLDPFIITHTTAHVMEIDMLTIQVGGLLPLLLEEIGI